MRKLRTLPYAALVTVAVSLGTIVPAEQGAHAQCGHPAVAATAVAVATGPFNRSGHQ